MPRHRSTPESLARTRERRASLTETAPVMEAAARFLEARPRSVEETRRRLARAGYPGSLVEQVIARLVAVGYLDDAAFARAWVEARDRSRPRGEAALRRELALRGVAPDVIAAALEKRRESWHGPEPGDERVGGAPGMSDGGPASARGGEMERDPDDVAAASVLERRDATLRREPDPRRRRARAYALLARHGFDPETCRSAVAAWMSGTAAGGTTDGGSGDLESGDGPADV